MAEHEMQRVALITGVSGEDGAYLAQFLLEKGYIVHGIRRRLSLLKTDRIDHLYKDPHSPDCKFYLPYGDLTDSSSLTRVTQQVQSGRVLQPCRAESCCRVGKLGSRACAIR